MRVVTKSSFDRDIKKLQDAKVLARTQDCVKAALTAATPLTLADVVAMSRYPGYSRIRVGDYRIGFH